MIEHTELILSIPACAAHRSNGVRRPLPDNRELCLIYFHRLERMLHSTLASRVTLHMRDQVSQGRNQPLGSEHEMHASRVALPRTKNESSFLPIR